MLARWQSFYLRWQAETAVLCGVSAVRQLPYLPTQSTEALILVAWIFHVKHLHGVNSRHGEYILTSHYDEKGEGEFDKRNHVTIENYLN